MSKARTATSTFIQGSVISLGGMVLLGFLNYIVRRFLAVNLAETDYGFLFSALSLISICLAYLDCGIGQCVTILQAKHISLENHSKVSAVYSLSTAYKLAGGIVIASAIWFASPILLESYFKTASHAHWLRLLCFYVPVASVAGIVLSTLAAHKAFLTSSIFQVAQAALLFVLLYVLWQDVANAVPLAYLISAGASVVAGMTFIGLRYRLWPTLAPGMSIRQTGAEIFHLSKWIGISVLGFSTMYYMDTIMLTHFRGLKSVAQYNVALPVMQIVQSMMVFPMIFTPIATQMWQRQELDELRRICGMMFNLVVTVFWPVVIFFFFNGAAIITLLFDSRFTGAATALTILCAGMCTFVIGQFFINILNAIDRPRIVATIVVAGACLNIACNAALIPLWDIEGAAMATCGSYVFIAIAAYIVARRTIGLSQKWRPTILTSICGAGCLIGAWAVRSQYPVQEWPKALGWSMAICAAYAVPAIYLQRTVLRNAITRVLARKKNRSK